MLFCVHASSACPAAAGTPNMSFCQTITFSGQCSNVAMKQLPSADPCSTTPREHCLFFGGGAMASPGSFRRHGYGCSEASLGFGATNSVLPLREQLSAVLNTCAGSDQQSARHNSPVSSASIWCRNLYRPQQRALTRLFRAARLLTAYTAWRSALTASTPTSGSAIAVAS